MFSVGDEVELEVKYNILLFNTDDSLLQERKEQIIESFGGFRSLLNNLLSTSSFKNDLLMQLLSESQCLYDPNISQFINEMVSILCNLVEKTKWSLNIKRSDKHINGLKSKDLQHSIADIIFEYGSTYNLWEIPKEIGICCNGKVTFNPSNSNFTDCYQTAFIPHFKIDPNIIGKYCCSIKASMVCIETYFGIIDVENANKNAFLTCIGYLELNSGYGYCFNRGGYYHDEQRDPVGGAYNINYSNETSQNVTDVMNVFITVNSNNKGTIDWGLNNKVFAAESIDITIPSNGLLFACSTIGQKVSFEIVKIISPVHAIYFD